MIQFLMLVLMWQGTIDTGQLTPQPLLDTDYRAAKYSSFIDLTYVQDLVPGLRSSMISYQYFIQYGEDTTIQIAFPDNATDYLPVKMVTWDYPKGIFTVEFIFHKQMKYYIGVDSILFAIEESRDIVEQLCDPVVLRSTCDSVMITKQTSNTEYVAYLSDMLANIKSDDLFYPDLTYLPYKVVRKNPPKSTWILEELLYGKPSIDSLIRTFHHEGYERISEEEWQSAPLQLPDAAREVLERVQQRMKE